MNINRYAIFATLALVAVFCLSTPLSYSAEQSSSSSRQQLIAIVNLEEESSANAVSMDNGTVVFQGNELVDSVAKQMSANGTLPSGSTLALSTDSKNMDFGSQTTPTPMDLVERDLQKSQGVEFDALTNNALKITRDPLSGMTPIPNKNPSVSSQNVGSGVGTGGVHGR